ncbi:MAG: hypothetical protein ACUVSX_09920 [Aggregatilineales bacterium]
MIHKIGAVYADSQQQYAEISGIGAAVKRSALDLIAKVAKAFEGRLLNWDAWGIDIFYDDRMWLAEPASSIQVVEAGLLRATVEVIRTRWDWTRRGVPDCRGQ